ncbi:MAG TPA: hypothetical protein PK275_09570 [Chitinophagaceae bacterium]|nr:hypothetical protein [Chitinophagaceae bacterium]
MKINGRIILFTIVLVALQTICKLAFADKLDWSGFSPLIVIALFSGFIIKEKSMSFLLPLLALIISDVIIQILYNSGQFSFPGFYSGQWINYIILLTITVIGWILQGRRYGSLALGAVVAPTLYFLVSNFVVWQGASASWYSKDFSGLMNCYEAGLPFYRNSVLAMLVFLPVILVCYNVIVKQRTALKLA